MKHLRPDVTPSRGTSREVPPARHATRDPRTAVAGHSTSYMARPRRRAGRLASRVGWGLMGVSVAGMVALIMIGRAQMGAPAGMDATSGVAQASAPAALPQLMNIAGGSLPAAAVTATRKQSENVEASASPEDRARELRERHAEAARQRAQSTAGTGQDAPRL